jgi:hypothetical protein
MKAYISGLTSETKIELFNLLYQDLAGLGTEGDTELAHVNKEEMRVLKAMGGSGTKNPHTDLIQFGGGGSPPPAPTTQTTIQERTIPDELKPFVTDILEKSKAIQEERADTGYEAYEGQRIADFTQDQQDAFQGVRDQVGAGQGYFDKSEALLDKATTANTSEDVQSFMSPYMQNVVDIQQREAQRAADVQRQNISGKAAAAGGLGGSRHGIVEAEHYRNLATQKGDIQQKGLAAAFEDAQRRLSEQKSREFQGAAGQANLGVTAPSQASQEFRNLEAVGAQNQAQAQQALNIDQQEYEISRTFPERTLQDYNSIVRGYSSPIPASSQTTSSLQKPAPSFLSQATGAGLAAAGMYNAFKSEGGLVGLAQGGVVGSKKNIGQSTKEGLLSYLQNNVFHKEDPKSYDERVKAIRRNRMFEEQRRKDRQADPNTLLLAEGGTTNGGYNGVLQQLLERMSASSGNRSSGRSYEEDVLAQRRKILDQRRKLQELANRVQSKFSPSVASTIARDMGVPERSLREKVGDTFAPTDKEQAWKDDAIYGAYRRGPSKLEVPEDMQSPSAIGQLYNSVINKGREYADTLGARPARPKRKEKTDRSLYGALEKTSRGMNTTRDYMLDKLGIINRKAGEFIVDRGVDAYNYHKSLEDKGEGVRLGRKPIMPNDLSESVGGDQDRTSGYANALAGITGNKEEYDDFDSSAGDTSTTAADTKAAKTPATVKAEAAVPNLKPRPQTTIDISDTIDKLYSMPTVIDDGIGGEGGDSFESTQPNLAEIAAKYKKDVIAGDTSTTAATVKAKEAAAQNLVTEAGVEKTPATMGFASSLLQDKYMKKFIDINNKKRSGIENRKDQINSDKWMQVANLGFHILSQPGGQTFLESIGKGAVTSDLVGNLTKLNSKQRDLAARLPELSKEELKLEMGLDDKQYDRYIKMKTLSAKYLAAKGKAYWKDLGYKKGVTKLQMDWWEGKDSKDRIRGNSFYASLTDRSRLPKKADEYGLTPKELFGWEYGQVDHLDDDESKAAFWNAYQSTFLKTNDGTASEKQGLIAALKRSRQIKETIASRKQ